MWLFLNESFTERERHWPKSLHFLQHNMVLELGFMIKIIDLISIFPQFFFLNQQIKDIWIALLCCKIGPIFSWFLVYQESLRVIQTQMQRSKGMQRDVYFMLRVTMWWQFSPNYNEAQISFHLWKADIRIILDMEVWKELAICRQASLRYCANRHKGLMMCKAVTVLPSGLQGQKFE